MQKIIHFFSKLQKLKSYKNVLIIAQNEIINNKLFSAINNNAIRFCSSIDKLCRIKYEDIHSANIKYDCIFLFCFKDDAVNFLKHLVQSPEFYNIDLFLPSSLAI